MAIPFPTNEVYPLIKSIEEAQIQGSYFVVESTQLTVGGSSSVNLDLDGVHNVTCSSFMIEHLIINTEDGLGGLPGAGSFDFLIFERSARLPMDLIFEERNLDASKGKIMLNALTVFRNREAIVVPELYIAIVNKEGSAKRFSIEFRCTRS